MQVQRFDPFSVLARMDREFDELVRRGWSGGRSAGVAGFVPAVELVREGHDVVVRVELPGVDVERDVAIEVERGKLVITGERRDPWADRSERSEAAEQGQQEDGARLLVRELRYGQFRREFALPSGISPEQVEATYDAGMLAVRVRAVVQPEPRPVRVPVTTARRPEAARVLEHDPQEKAEPAQPAQG